MAITQGYATLSEVKAWLKITSTDAADDAVLEDAVEQASRAIDLCAGRQFFASTETRYFDVPSGRRLELDKPLLSVTTLTNGNAVAIASTEYNLWPKNGVRHWAIIMRQTSSIIWQPTSGGDTESAITLVGSWGDVSRVATDSESVMLIETSHKACLHAVSDAYHKRFGENVGGVAAITGAGVVITPQGLPQDVRDMILPLRRMV